MVRKVAISELKAHCLRHIGDLALELGRADEARAAIAGAEAFYRAAGDDPLALANTLRLRGLNHGDRDAWQEARALYAAMAADRDLPLEAAIAECDRHLRDNA